MRATLASLVCFAEAPVFGQGSLTPTAAPTPTMRTLDQVEPRGIIAQPISPATLPITITAEGSYYLTTNIVAPAGYTSYGISVLASNVTIDLNGFELAGVTGSGSGIFISGGQSNITIRNGTIRNWGSNGIDGVGNQRIRAESLRVISNASTGLFLDAGAVVLNCIAYGNGGNGIVGRAHSLVRDCDASANGVVGISAGAGSVVQGCAANGNTSKGIEILDGGTITGCSVSASGINGATTPNVDGISITKNCSVTATTSNGNTGLGIRVSTSVVGNGAVIANSTFELNTLGGIFVPTNGSRLVGNLIFSNSGAGILVTASTGGNVIDGNTITSNSGLRFNLTTAGNLSVRNNAPGNTMGNFSAVAGNANAQVITGAANFVSTDPNANISY